MPQHLQLVKVNTTMRISAVVLAAVPALVLLSGCSNSAGGAADKPGPGHSLEYILQGLAQREYCGTINGSLARWPGNGDRWDVAVKEGIEEKVCPQALQIFQRFLKSPPTSSDFYDGSQIYLVGDNRCMFEPRQPQHNYVFCDIPSTPTLAASRVIMARHD